MIYPTTSVHWLDIKEQMPYHKNIEEMFQKYCCFAKLLLDDTTNKVEQISFTDSIKIKDLTGWTDVQSIRKIVYKKEIHWYHIKCMGLLENIILSDDELIPVYDINQPTRGFHGEIKYPYILMNPEKIPPEDTHRLRVHPLNAFALEFLPYQITPYLESKKNEGYQIITKSRFFNGNHIHLYGSDEVSIEDIEKWYK